MLRFEAVVEARVRAYREARELIKSKPKEVLANGPGWVLRVSGDPSAPRLHIDMLGVNGRFEGSLCLDADNAKALADALRHVTAEVSA